MKQYDLVGADLKLILKENVLAVISDAPLNTVSSAFHNGGGSKKTNMILNVEVPKSYGDRNLHDDPDAFITNSARTFGIKGGFIGMVTAAAVTNFALVSRKEGDLGVSVVATAADNEGHTCNHAESAGEKIDLEDAAGTINIIVVVDGNPTESCLVSLLITATEAKMASLKELDIRSRYSGDEATGTITDAMVVAETEHGPPIIYGGPASPLGQLVGYCTRKAVREAVMKANECAPRRSLFDRLRERHLSISKIASELSKAKILDVDKETLETNLTSLLKADPFYASITIAAIKLDEDLEKGLVPPELGDSSLVSKRFGAVLLKQQTPRNVAASNSYSDVDLPPFLKQALISIIKSNFLEKTN